MTAFKISEAMLCKVVAPLLGASAARDASKGVRLSGDSYAVARRVHTSGPQGITWAPQDSHHSGRVYTSKGLHGCTE